LANTGGGLNMNSAGTLILTGANTFSGGTTVTSGTLRVNGTISGITDVAGGIASGSGTYGDVTLDAGTFTAGSATSTGTVAASSLAVNSGTLRLKFGGSSADVVNLTGGTNVTNSQISVG